MANVASPYGLRPVNLIGGQSFTGGTIREFKLSTNVASAYYTGQVIYMNTAAVPTPIGSSPVACEYAATSAPGTAGILGVMVGCRYVDPTLKYVVHSQYLPTGAVTAGYTDIWLKIIDDPDQLYSIQADTAVGTKPGGVRGAIGQNAPLKTFTGSTVTGLSAMVLDTGTNWGTLAATTTLAMRVVDVITPDDTYPELLVKFNFGLHSYYNPLGIASS